MYEGLKNLEVPRRPRRKKHRWLRWVGFFALVLMVAGGSGLFYVYKRVEGNLDKSRREIENLARALPDQPFNVLILGSDRRDVIEGKEKEKRQFKGDVGQRADVMILLHIAPKAESAVMVSLPRDLRVTIPGVGTDKLNAAYAYGGPDLTVETVREFTGMNIHHYVEVNFASFRDIVDAIGGVRIYVDRPLFDKRSGLKVPEAGCIAMNGNTALSYVRARYIDPTADIGRMQRQQLFMRTVLRKVRSSSFFLNPTRWLNLSEAIGNGVIFDENVDLKLGRKVAAVLAAHEEEIDFRIVPYYLDLIGGISYVVPIESQAAELFKAIKRDQELPDYGKTEASKPKPTDVSVQILNGTDIKGLAAREQKRLAKKLFDVDSIGNAGANEHQTIVEYELGDELMAKLVARSYPGSKLRLVDDVPYDVTVRVGADHAYRVAMNDWERAVKRAERRGEEPPPEPSPPPEAAEPSPSSSASGTPTVDPEKKKCA